MNGDDLLDRIETLGGRAPSTQRRAGNLLAQGLTEGVTLPTSGRGPAQRGEPTAFG
jgi:hypothetical protein